MDVPLYTTPFVWAMNKDKYDVDVGGAEEGHRRPLHQRVGREGRLAVGRLRVRRPRQARWARPGTRSYKLTPEQLDAWRKAIAPTEAAWAEGASKAGYDPKEVMDSLKSTVAKYKAGV